MGPLHRTISGVKKTRHICERLNTDYCVFVTGLEGTGKSSLASHLVKTFDPSFDIDSQMIYELKGSQNSLTNFMKLYADVPFKAAWYDEAVSVLFSLNHGTKASAEAQEIFKVKRACRHFDVLVSPSFWDLVPDIRERRVKVVLYTFREPVYGKAGSEPEYVYKVAFFGTRKILHLSANKHAKLSFRSPKDLFRIVSPDYIEEFPPMDPIFSLKYLASKREHLSGIMDRVSGERKANISPSGPCAPDIGSI